MKNKILMSSVTALLAAITTFTGCSDTTEIDSTYSIVAADGYIVKLQTPASVTCEDGSIYTTTSVGAKGLLTFEGLLNAEGCFISVPKDAIVDSDGDSIYTAADENNFIGYEMTAEGGKDEVLSQFSTLAVDYTKHGKTAAADNLRKVTKYLDPVKEIENAASPDNAKRTKSIQLIALSETIKTAKKIGTPSMEMVKINAEVTLRAIDNELLVVDAVAIAGTLPAATKTAVISKTEIIANIASLLKGITESSSSTTKTDITKLMISISDGGSSVTVALDKSTSGSNGEAVDFDYRAVSFDETDAADADRALEDSKADKDAAVAELPAHLTLGPILTLGDLSVALSPTGTFNLVLDVNESTNLVDFSKITFPSATITKGFPTQNIGLMSSIIEKSNEENIITFELAYQSKAMLLDAGENNISVAITVPAGTAAHIFDSVAGEDYSKITEVEQINTDLEFDACTAIGGCENNLIDGLNDYLRVPGKEYNVTIVISGFDNDISPDGQLTVDYTTVTGTVRTK